jgi:hypothetical protein
MSENTATPVVRRAHDFSTCCHDFLLLLHAVSIPGCGGEDDAAIAIDEELEKRGVLCTDAEGGLSFDPVDDSLLDIFITNGQEAITNIRGLLTSAAVEQARRRWLKNPVKP